MIRIICVGKIKEKYLQDAIEEYKKRLSKYTKLEIIELKDLDYEKDKTIKLEGESILKQIKDKDYVITLEIDGEKLSSMEFSKELDKISIENGNMDFIIGGSYGISDEVKNRSNKHLSFSNLTFPHQLFRVMLLEQIYRAYKIINNESYHK